LKKKGNNMRYATLQQEEHYEFETGAASEFENCFTEAQQAAYELAAKESVSINKAKALGLFVVVLKCEYHCASTDALAGSYNRFVCAFPTWESAAAKINKLYEGLDAYCRGHYNYEVV
jgi:hypothetical protein